MWIDTPGSAGFRTPEQDAEDLGLVLREARETQGVALQSWRDAPTSR
jgi:hypothetical protein